MTVPTGAPVPFGCSFEPNGAWFVFDARSGRTVRRGFASRRQAQAWIGRQKREDR